MSEYRSYWVQEPYKGKIVTGAKPLALQKEIETLSLKTLFTGVSPGTERLVASGSLGAFEQAHMSVPYMEGDFSLPIKYGYNLIGETEEGERYFCFHPHQNRVVVKKEDVLSLGDLDPSKAIVYPFLETAVNAIWDANFQLGQNVAVVGGGLLGCCLSWVFSKALGTKVTLIESSEAKRSFIQAKGFASCATADAKENYDLVFHTTAHVGGLNTAFELAGFGANIVELSWFGSEQLEGLRLSTKFHCMRQHYISSQVSHVSDKVAHQFDFKRRSRFVLNLIASHSVEELITNQIDFEDLPHYMQNMYARKTQDLLTRVVY